MAIPMKLINNDELVNVAVKDVVVTGGGGGTSNYNLLINKPSINGIVLQGDKSLNDLGINAEVDRYVEEHKAELKGDKGDQGDKGDSIKGDKGDDGFSPSAKVERISNGAKITITDREGTTEAVVHDGEGEGGSSDYTELSNKPKLNGIELVGNVTAGYKTFVATVEGTRLKIGQTEDGNEVMY